MARMSLLGYLLLLCAAAGLSWSDAFAAPNADVYGSAPDYDSPRISPTGTHLAILMPLGENGGVKILDLAKGTSCGIAPSTVKVRSAFWVGPNRLAVRVSFFFRPKGVPSSQSQYQYEISRNITMNADCKGSYDVLRDHPDYGQLAGFDYVGRAADGAFLLFAAYTTHTMRDSYDVYKIDGESGKSERIETGTAGTYDWLADGQGRVRLRVDLDTLGKDRVFSRVDGSDDWVQVYDSSAAKDVSYELQFVALAANPDIAYVVTRNGGDRNAVYEFNLKSKSLARLVFQHPSVDVDGLALDSFSRAAVGTLYTIDYPTTEYFDRGYAQMLADVQATFPGEHIEIESATHDKKKFVALVEGSQNPTGAYYLVDMTEPSVGKIGARYAAIGAADLGQTKSITYQARDGLTIPAYLTLPPGSSGKNLPLVVMPHGGPHSRDTANFDPWTQFLASRGYAVLRPQFRGSSGYGAKHLDAGKFQWGLAMQDDVTDGVKHLVANGTADASKVCIYGWSYGGYAAMAGLALTPELYKCGAAGAGVSDLLLFLGDSTRRSSARGNYWKDYIGSPINDRDRLIATSTIKKVERIRAPLLLIHGKDDTVVPVRQSTLMANALKAAGKPVEYVEIEGDDHWLSKASTKRRVLNELERFLAQHLK